MKVVLMGIHSAANADRLRAKLDRPAEIVTHLPEDPPESLAGKLVDADILVSMRVDPSLPPAPALKLLQLPGAGYDAIDWSALPPGLPVCNVYEHEIGIGEYVMLAMLEWSIGLCRMNETFRGGRWEHSLTALGATHEELAAKTVAIVGYGHIGRAIGVRALAFGMHVIAVTRSGAPSDDSRDVAFAPVAALDDVLRRADFVVLACPLTEATRGLFDRGRFAAMKPSGVLVNVARADICREDDLYEALAEGAIGGAVLDVWYRYPPPGEQPDGFRPSRRPFHELDNVVMTPHASAWTEGLLERRWTVIARNVARAMDGAALENRIERP